MPAQPPARLSGITSSHGLSLSFKPGPAATIDTFDPVRATFLSGQEAMDRGDWRTAEFDLYTAVTQWERFPQLGLVAFVSYAEVKLMRGLYDDAHEMAKKAIVACAAGIGGSVLKEVVAVCHDVQARAHAVLAEIKARNGDMEGAKVQNFHSNLHANHADGFPGSREERYRQVVAAVTSEDQRKTQFDTRSGAQTKKIQTLVL